MKNIDQNLIDWAVKRIKTRYKEDIALLIGQVGACKTPDDRQEMAFDFFIPATERGNQLAQTFIIEDMGYDLYPISWERLQGIVDFHEPRMIFAFMKGEVIYARTEEDKKRYYDMKEQLRKHLEDSQLTYGKALESLSTAMEIYQTMMFEDSLCAVRKAAGGVSCYLTNAIAMVNGQYLKNGYSNLTRELDAMREIPDQFMEIYHQLLSAATIEELQRNCQQLITLTRDFFLAKKNEKQAEVGAPGEINYDDLADWYQEARYSFRRIAYYTQHHEMEDCFMLGCYLQIEFDAIQEDFGLQAMDLLGKFDGQHLELLAERAKELEDYIVSVLKENHAEVRIYGSLEEFLVNQA